MHFDESIVQMVVGPGPDGPLYVVEGGRVHTLDLGSFREAGAPFGHRIEAIAPMPGGKACSPPGRTGRPVSWRSAQADRSARSWSMTSRSVPWRSPPTAGRCSPGRESGSGSGTPRRASCSARPESTAAWCATGAVADRSHVFFSPDGRTAASVGGSVVLWDIPGPGGDISGGPATSGRHGPRPDRDGPRGIGRRPDAGGPGLANSLAERDGRGTDRTGSARSDSDWHDRLASEGGAIPTDFTHSGISTAWSRPAPTTGPPMRDGRAPVAERAMSPGADADLARARAARCTGRVPSLGGPRGLRSGDGRDGERAMADRPYLIFDGSPRRRARTPRCCWRLAEVDIRLGRWDDAEVELAAAISSLGRASLDSMFYRNLPGYLAALRLNNGHHDLYRDDCRKLLEWAGDRPSPMIAYCVVWHCSVGPDAVDDPMIPVRVAERRWARPGVVATVEIGGIRGGPLPRRPSRRRGRAARGGRTRLGRRPFAAPGVPGHGQPGPGPPGRGPTLARPAPQPYGHPSGDWDLPWDELEVGNLRREAEAVVLLDPGFPVDPFRR